MDAFDGVDIILFPGVLLPGEEEIHLEIHASVDESMPLSIISEPVLNSLQRGCRPCEAAEIHNGRSETFRPFGKIDLQWHKVGFAKQYAETFYVIQSKTKLVTFGATWNHDDEAGAGTYPLELGQQTPEQKAQQAQKKVEAEKRRAEEVKQQEARDREKRQT
ncbi:MAG: hypothetical protein Q9211_002720 [Gyalolechia sp. 1 TL-2023]